MCFHRQEVPFNVPVAIKHRSMTRAFLRTSFKTPATTLVTNALDSTNAPPEEGHSSRPLTVKTTQVNTMIRPSSCTTPRPGRMKKNSSHRPEHGSPWTPRLGIQLGGFDPARPCAPPPRKVFGGAEDPGVPGPHGWGMMVRRSLPVLMTGTCTSSHSVSPMRLS